MRFAASSSCPACGSDAAPVYPLIDEILHYARLTLATQGNLELPAFQPATDADRYVVLGYDLLEAFRRIGDVDPELVAAEAVEHYQLGLREGESERAHWRAFFAALLAGWREQRHRPLDALPPSNSVGLGVAEPLVSARPVSSQSFRKKWSPKA
ncbi:MAG: hypothetical protein HZB16_12635 [Armatimonadetes bacterium]|nr:hypothetical protein [Armatimonadota bacterium]